MKYFDRIEATVDALKSKLHKSMIPVRNSPKLVFICGESIVAENGQIKDQSELAENKRFKLKKVLDEKEHIIPIIAENLYDISKHDALTFEHLLAELSHSIVIILESYGTVCELGAFSSNDDIARKLHVFNDKLYESENSFINTGPIRKIQEIDESRVGFVKFNDDFSSLPEVSSFLNDVSNIKVHVHVHDGNHSFKLIHFFFSVLSIVQLLGPVSKKEVSDYFKRLYGVASYEILTSEKFNIRTTTEILNLALRMELVYIKEICGDKYYQSNIKYDFKNYIFDISDYEFNKHRTEITNIYQKVGRK